MITDEVWVDRRCYGAKDCTLFYRQGYLSSKIVPISSLLVAELLIVSFTTCDIILFVTKWLLLLSYDAVAFSYIDVQKLKF